MRSIDTLLDRFCNKHPRLGIPNLMVMIIVGNVLVYLLAAFSPMGFGLYGMLGFSPYAVLHGQIWRIVTFLFVPNTTNVLLLIISLYFYYFIGTTLEREWGTTKFTVFYVMGALLNLVFGFLFYLFDAGAYVDMSYVNLSLFFSFATLYPDTRFLLFYIIPVKAKWLAWFDAAFFGLSILMSLFALDIVGALLPLVAILNYILFFWSDIMDFVQRRVRRAKHQNSRQTIHFKSAAAEAKHQKGYIHKCAVCGKTDTDYPDEEFRYCSKCNGYYCYCSEHINSHVHIE